MALVGVGDAAFGNAAIMRLADSSMVLRTVPRAQSTQPKAETKMATGSQSSGPMTTNQAMAIRPTTTRQLPSKIIRHP